MRNFALRFLAAVFTFAISSSAPLWAQGKIVCWKDKAGKVIGCGDKVPPEFQSSATKELDSRGVTRKSTESVDETNQRRLREQDAAKVKSEEDRKLLDLKRQDTALLQTYSNEREIDLKRERDLQVIDMQMEQIASSLKRANQQHSETRTRIETVEKNGKVPSAALKTELTRAAASQQQLEHNLAAKQKEKEDVRQRFAEYRRRYTELRGGVTPVSTSEAKK
jgi:chromosome segregation ATPase